MKIRWISLLVLLVFILTGCVPSQANATESSVLPLSSPTSEPLSTLIPAQPIEGDITQMNPSLPTPSASVLENLIEKAKKHLAQRLSISITQISLVEAKAIVWPDSSLGCPQPGMAYLQVPQDGALIIVRAEGNIYEYHNGGHRSLFLCEKLFKAPSPPPQLDIFNLTPPRNTISSTPDNSIPPDEDK